MKRPIKFRAWLPALKIMLYNVSVYDDGLLGISEDDFREQLRKHDYSLEDNTVFDKGENHRMTVISGDDWYWLNDNQYELMQYLDKIDTSKEALYEGDVVSFSWNPILNSPGGIFEFELPIEYDNDWGCFVMRIKNTKSGQEVRVAVGSTPVTKTGHIYDGKKRNSR